ncbi:hypothetical protein [Campylobacter corcagiensis]|uniref:Uncharacterized protein n=1 Tax=Campylobacter corcagiensis TaxID=1448857 RepID=A0A7M1LGI6_9BACT|nr:hypothetical protein [Campylobacter corcagiensis]QKF64260.1 hypothetical protein CCORG_0379 [Campylobacter corcagiensis]QOQ87550.1 hypothetical protein IMC76_01675 [Campylobacter corcagiensis]
MQIIGHELIKFNKFKEVSDVQNLVNFDNVIFKFSEELIKAALDTNKTFSVYANSQNEVVLANALGAKFIVISNENSFLIQEAMKYAEYYLFDSKIATIVDNFDNDLNIALNLGVDAVIHRAAIVP